MSYHRNVYWVILNPPPPQLHIINHESVIVWFVWTDSLIILMILNIMLSSSFRFFFFCFYMLWSSLCQSGILKHSMTNCKVRHVIVHLQLYIASVSLSLVGLSPAKSWHLARCLWGLMVRYGRVTAWCGCAATSMNKDWLWPRGCIRCPVATFILFHQSTTLAVQYLLLLHWQWQYLVQWNPIEDYLKLNKKFNFLHMIT